MIFDRLLCINTFFSLGTGKNLVQTDVIDSLVTPRSLILIYFGCLEMGMDGWQSEVWRLLNGEKGKKGNGDNG